MEPRAYPPPDPYAAPAILDTAPVRRGRTGKVVAIVGASVLGFAVIVGVAVVAVLAAIDGHRAGAEPTPHYFTPSDGQFVSSDGTFAMTLPAGWADETEAYRASFQRDHGSASTIEGLATADGLSYASSANFVSMSGHPTASFGGSAAKIGSRDLDDWRSAFDESVDLPPETFATDAGDSVWLSGLRGTTGGDEWMIVVSTVVGKDSLARFDLQLTPAYFATLDDFRTALASVVFAPVGAS